MRSQRPDHLGGLTAEVNTDAMGNLIANLPGLGQVLRSGYVTEDSWQIGPGAISWSIWPEKQEFHIK